jgi:site-specific recombinase XerD
MRPAGITGRHATPRGLRHASGVGVLQAAVSLNPVQRWLGLSRISTTAMRMVSGDEEIGIAQRFEGLD